MLTQRTGRTKTQMLEMAKEEEERRRKEEEQRRIEEARRRAKVGGEREQASAEGHTGELGPGGQRRQVRWKEDVAR